MQKNIFRQPIIYIALVIFLSGNCRELVTDEFPDMVKTPTVNSILVAGESVKLHLSFAAKLGTNRLETIDNATVALYINSEYVENLTTNGEGLYTGTTIVEPQKTYSCNINIPGFEEINCNTTVPPTPEIQNIEHILKAGVDEEGRTYPAAEITFANNPAEVQYFQTVIRLHSYGDIREPYYSNITDEILLAEGLPILVFNNQLIDAESYTMHIDYQTGNHIKSGDSGWKTVLFPFVVELKAISEDYYHFLRQSYIYEQGRYPYVIGGVVQTSQMYSNIENGYGIFAGYSSVVSDTIKVPQNY